MYLIEISDRTGLIKEDPLGDGWKAIKSFFDVYSDKKLGLECLTAIALSVDHNSPIRYYSIVDRPKKAMELTTGNRNAFNWNQEKIQQAMNDYLALQYSPALEEKALLDELRIEKLTEIQDEKDKNKKTELFKQLSNITKLIEDFKKNNPEENLYDSSPVRSGYKLSRLEQKLLNKKSFYYGKIKQRTKTESN